MKLIGELGRSACITTALALSIFLFAPNVARVNAQGPGQAGQAGAGPGGAPGGPGGRGQGGGGGAPPVDLEGKTAGEVFKSVKVLKDIPANELAPTMVFITQALGVRCDHCHVPMHFDADDKKEKDKARDMMKMMAAINTENFKGERVVTCNTCHNGATPPSGIPLLPGQAPAGMQLLAAPAGAPGGRGPGQGGGAGQGPGGQPGGAPGGGGPGGGRGPGAAAGPPPFVGPAPADILSKYTQALGGADAIKKVTSRVQSGTVDMVQQGPPGAPPQPPPAIEAYWTASGKAFQVVHTQRGDNAQGYDGKNGWASGGFGGASAEPAGAMVAFREWAELFPALHFTGQYTKITVEGIDKIGDHSAYRVVGERKDSVDRLYFDTDSGLLLRTWTTFDTALGEVPQQTDYEDYRDVSGVKIPYSVHVVSAEGGTRTYKWDQIQVNGTVDESKSNRPAPKLAGPPPGAPAAGGPPRQ
jgi:photosynthetic reaction center cytochrome c subunit